MLTDPLALVATELAEDDRNEAGHPLQRMRRWCTVRREAGGRFGVWEWEHRRGAPRMWWWFTRLPPHRCERRTLVGTADDAFEAMIIARRELGVGDFPWRVRRRRPRRRSLTGRLKSTVRHADAEDVGNAVAIPPVALWLLGCGFVLSTVAPAHPWTGLVVGLLFLPGAIGVYILVAAPVSWLWEWLVRRR